MTREGTFKQIVQELQQPKLNWSWINKEDMVAHFIIPEEFAGTLTVETYPNYGDDYQITIAGGMGINRIVEQGIPDVLAAVIRAEELLFSDYPNAQPAEKDELGRLVPKTD